MEVSGSEDDGETIPASLISVGHEHGTVNIVHLPNQIIITPAPAMPIQTQQPQMVKFNHGNGLDDFLQHSSKSRPLGTQEVIRYKECLRNHAASVGGYAIDGCSEFMAGAATLEVFICSVSNCHRNFHRKEVAKGDDIKQGIVLSESEEEPDSLTRSSGQQQQQPKAKRFRSTFSNVQKDKMMEFCKRVEWKIQKEEESVVEQFCAEIGVKRRVLKVWMHNNKHNKQQVSAARSFTAGSRRDGLIDQ
ncbi:hypothetical protein QQ045_013819 [Rhodiola kirilowii]